MSLYVGINNAPKNIISLLIGASDKNKEISNAYTGGVNSKSLIYSSFNLDKELTKVNPVDALISKKITKDDIGKTVYLSNSVIACQEWRIADINHDNTNGTVDLFPKYTLNNDDGYRDTHYMYGDSFLRSYLNNRAYNGFTEEIKNAMKVQAFPSNGTTLNDKVKCPSLTELGVKVGIYDYLIIEGSKYPIFNSNNDRIIKTISGQSATYWTRSLSTDSGAYRWCINTNGSGQSNAYCGSSNPILQSGPYSLRIVACIRF